MNTENTYDSTQDTLEHIRRVQQLLNEAAGLLVERGRIHDTTKLLPPEKELFDEFTPKLKGCSYGSEEYKEFLEGLQVALQHHYKHNSHHPEFHKNGIRDMHLLDLLEMIVDWRAASERHADGDIMRSIDINQKRFGYTDELREIFKNTARTMGWV